ncbi:MULTISPECIES: hypothetical protein [unclassified Mesorhizobium]|uniref:hypothetical protein n=1 Tax=unclassified Mesorhizobium TaxID=325217 RepID=UPI001FEDE635|nr:MULTISPECIES: hypothetical protein [unclassified Mesorhizobium]
MALWISSQHRLDELRRAGAAKLRQAFEAGAGISVADHQLDVFLFEPGSDRYLGRLCSFNQCPKGKHDCLVPGCGTIPFNKRIADFQPYADLLERSHILLSTGGIAAYCVPRLNCRMSMRLAERLSQTSP